MRITCPTYWPALVAIMAALAATWGDARAQLAVADHVQTAGEPVTIDVLANDDTTLGVESVTLIGNPAYGSVAASGAPGWTFTYTPLPGFEQFASDGFRYQLLTSSGATSNAVVIISRVGTPAPDPEPSPDPSPDPEPEPTRECIGVFWLDRDAGTIGGRFNCDE